MPGLKYGDLSTGQKARLTRLFSLAAEAGDVNASQLRQLADGDRNAYTAAVNGLLAEGRVGLDTNGRIFFDNRVEEEPITEEPAAEEPVAAEPAAAEPAITPFASTASEPSKEVLDAVDRTVAIRVSVEMATITVAIETALISLAERTLMKIEATAVEKARQACAQREPLRSLSLHLLACQQVQYEAVLSSLKRPGSEINVAEVSASVFTQIVEEAKQRASQQR